MLPPIRAGRLFVAAVCVFALLSGASRAQDNPLLPADGQAAPSLPPAADPEQPMQDPVIQLDMRQMLTADLMPRTHGDGLWKMQPRVGARLVVVPVRIEPGELAYELNSGTLNLRGGRLLAWQVPQSRTQQVRAGARDGQAAYSDEPPHITRKIVVMPDGAVRWGMDRNILGGEPANTASVYALKVDPRRLQDLRPKRPTPPQIPRSATSPRPTTRPTDAEAIRRAAEAERQRRRQEAERLKAEREKYQEALAEYRRELADYSNLIKRVNSLPSEFERPDPGFVWAIFELTDRMTSLDITGPAPLPYSIELEQLQVMRNLASARNLGSVKEMPAAAADEIRALLALVKVSPHAFSLRGAAHALRLGGAVHLTTEDSDLYQLIDAIVQGPDSEARHTLYAALIRVPEKPATTALINQATRYFTPEEQIEAVQARLEFDPKSAQEVDGSLQTANDALAQAGQVSPADVLGALMQFTPPDNEALLDRVANRVQFAGIPAAQRDNAIVFTVSQAPFEPLAARWLDVQLLSATDTSLVSRTLEILANATQVGEDEAQADDTDADGAGTRLPPGRAGVPQLRLKGLIDVQSVDHGLYRALRHPDALIRDVGWRAVRHFAIAEKWRRSKEQTLADSDPYQALVAAALNHQPTPTYAVKFLYGQPDALRAVHGVTRILLRGGDDASDLAARTLLGWNAPLDIVMDGMNFTDREACAVLMYQRLQDSKPLVTGLFGERIDKNPIVAWFGRRIMRNELPAPSQYIEAYARPERLMELLALKDEKVSQGAFAALVAAIGGDDLTAREHWPKITEQQDKSVPSLKLVWTQIERQIIDVARRRQSGPYQLTVSAPTNPEPGNPIANDPPIDLGQVDMVMGEDSVRFEGKTTTLSIPQDESRLIIRMNRPAELKQFPAPGLFKLPLQSVLEPLDLTLQSDGSWRGVIEMPDDYSVVVTLKPIRATP